MNEYTKYVGLDTHKETIAVAVALAGRQPPQFHGEIPNTPEAIRKLVHKLSPQGEVLAFCYEAGPCGYEIHRQLIKMGHVCEVVAPSLIPKKSGERVKTDRRDALQLAKLYRSGELTPVWVSDREQEAMRDLTRAREDMKAIELKARQRLGAFLLRHGKIYKDGKCRWTKTHFRWLADLKFDAPVQQFVLQEYVDAVIQAQQRVARLEEEMRRALPNWSLGSVVKALMAQGASMSSLPW